MRVHPETGERALYVNPSFTTHLVGVSPHESRRLLDLFYDALALPAAHRALQLGAGQRRVLGQPGRRPPRAPRPDHLDGDRRLFRVTLVGDVPVGIDGQPSVAIEGTPFEAL